MAGGGRGMLGCVRGRGSGRGEMRGIGKDEGRMGESGGEGVRVTGWVRVGEGGGEGVRVKGWVRVVGESAGKGALWMMGEFEDVAGDEDVMRMVGRDGRSGSGGWKAGAADVLVWMRARALRKAFRGCMLRARIVIDSNSS